MGCGVGHRRGLDLALLLLWLWRGPAAAVPIGLLAWEPPCAMGEALKKQKKKKKIQIRGTNINIIEENSTEVVAL